MRKRLRFCSSRPSPMSRVRTSRSAFNLETLESRLILSANVLTFHNNIASTGLNNAEIQLTPANVKVGSFGKLFTTAVDGQVYAQPLVYTGINIAAGVNTSSGATGTHDVVFVATQHDSLYAIDASVFGGTLLWKRSFTDITTPGYVGTTAGSNINNPLGTSTVISTIPNGEVSSSDINPEIGITGTPVIDSSSNTLYLVVKTKETIGGAVHYVQRLHAINTSDGTDRVTPYLIGDTTNGNTNITQIYAYGTGDGNVVDPYNATGKKVVQFNALREHQRGALSLVNNQLYVEWASHGDNGPYHGWVATWDVSALSTAGFVLKGVFNTSPNNGLSGIWQGGGRLAFEADGSAFYFETGNGSGGAPVLNAAGFPSTGNYNEALVKVVADPTTSPTNQNINGWGLKAADYFIPYNVAALDGADQDFGSGGPLLLPDSAGIAGHPHLMIAAGKEGKVYLLDRDKLGHYTVGSDAVVSTLVGGIGGSLSTPAYFNGHIYWTSGYSNTARELTIAADGTMSITSGTAATFGYLPGSAVVSANGTTNGVVWVMDTASNKIHAYDANTFATELWNSGQKAGGADNLGAAIKFATPAVVNGEVYVGTSNSLVVYGLTPPATQVPNTPVLTAATLSGSSVSLTWTDSSVAPNLASSYLVEQSLDGTTFTQVTTAPAGSLGISIGGLNTTTKYYFRVRSQNGVGYSNYSNIASATTTNQVALLDFTGGFVSSTSLLAYNGIAAINSSKAELTNGGAGKAGSVFSKNPVDITKFNSQFTFQTSSGGTTADGFTFTIQGVGPNALGPSGGGLGYGPDTAGGTGGIAKSIAIKFDLYSNSGEGPNSTGLYLNGAAPTNLGSIDLTPSGIDLHSGDIFQTNLIYDGTTLTVIIKDTLTGKTATQTYTVNIPGTVGASSAYVGFTGGTGGQSAIQDILTWTFSPNAPQAPTAPNSLGATPASATSVALNWVNTATNQTGFSLDRATDSGFTQNLITETLPTTPNTFTDISTGLAPGSTFYYRIRAFNTAGGSANSNMAVVTIPVAPAKPTNAAVTLVTTSEIDLSWTDNAGRTADNNLVLRAVNHGAFAVYATLPAFNHAPPNLYTWNDTSVTPGNYYEYHIEAVNISGHNDFTGTNATALTLAPSNLAATAGNGSVSLSWTAPTGAISYNLYRGTAPGAEGSTPLVTGLTTLADTDTAVVNGTKYYYVLTALNGNTAPLAAESAASNEASATPVASTLPAAPSTLTAAGVGQNTAASSVTLNWSAVAGALSYNVYRSTVTNGQTGPALVTGITSTTYIDTTAAFGTAYFYKVTTVAAGGESVKSIEASATPLFVGHVNFTAQAGLKNVPNYLNDTGLAYGNRGGGLTYGWNVDNTANARVRNASNSPDILHDTLIHLQKPSNPNANWGIAVPNGTYSVHLISGDPSYFDSNFKLNVGGTLSGSTITGGVLAINGVPTASARWVENTVTVTVTSGVLYVSNAPGSSNNKIDEIDITQVYLAQFAGALGGVTTNGKATVSGSTLVLTDGGTSEAASAYATSKLSVTKFTTSFGFQLVNPAADGFTFVLQNTGANALGATGGDLGYTGIGSSVAVKFDLYNNGGEGINSTGLYLKGASPTTPSTDLTGTGIDLHSGHLFNATISYDGATLKVVLLDSQTNATATQTYAVNIVGTVGGNSAFVGFTAGTGGLTAVQNILSWTYTPLA